MPEYLAADDKLIHVAAGVNSAWVISVEGDVCTSCPVNLNFSVFACSQLHKIRACTVMYV